MKEDLSSKSLLWATGALSRGALWEMTWDASLRVIPPYANCEELFLPSWGRVSVILINCLALPVASQAGAERPQAELAVGSPAQCISLAGPWRGR